MDEGIDLQEYLSFRKMITPLIIQIIFWVFTILIIINAFKMFRIDFWYGLLMLILGPIIVRVWCELIMIAFKIYDTLTEIKENTISSVTSNTTNDL